jgi:hypothetical protein
MGETVALAMLASIATGLICLVLARALLHKLIAHTDFQTTLAEYRILPVAWSTAAAHVLLLLEAAALVAIITPAHRQEGAVLAGGLFAVYSGAIAINLARGRDRLDCGCGGVERQLSWFLIARNVFLIAGCVCIVTGDMPAMLGLAECAAAAALVSLLWLLLALFDRILGNRSHERATSHGT